MAPRIQILPEELANQIAAGEVIERPASVVKELVENAIDAGSSRITIRIKSGGTRLISVEDDGSGMNPEDAVLALQRHATSKIRNQSDLFHIQNLGFRGEALPSIGSVSHLELTTREETDLSGTRILVRGGEIGPVEDAGRAVGTTVAVKQLFYNVPARRKFLKTPSTEFRHITRTVMTHGVAHPEIGFTLIHNDREQFQWPPVESVKGRLEAMYGPQLLKEALALDYQDACCRITGWIGLPEAARSSRIHQFIYVNKRSIVSQLVNHAVFQGYQPRLPKGKYPLIVLLMDIDLEAVDVNVHPAKREVRFSREQMVHHAVVEAIRKTLGEEASAPQWSPGQGQQQKRIDWKARFPFTDSSVQQDVKNRIPGRIGGDTDTGQMRIPMATDAGTYEQKGGRDDLAYLSVQDGDAGGPPKPDGEKVLLWQLHRRYIFAQLKDGAVILDQHAAHERILFETAIKRMNGSPGTGQQLLFPMTLEFSFEELAVLAEALPLLQQLGFGIKLFGGNTVVVEAVPAILGDKTGERTITELVDHLVQTGKSETDMVKRVAVSFACKAAIKDGDVLSQDEMNNLIDMLFATQDPFTCPHGRPTFIRMPLSELDKKFKR